MKYFVQKWERKNLFFVFQRANYAKQILRTTGVILFLLVSSFKTLNAQEVGLVPETPSFAVKTNLLFDATTTFNLGFEFKVSPKVTVDLNANYNPWVFKNEKKWKHVLVQPEARYWLCEAFNGTFLGAHVHWGKFNVGGVNLSDYMKAHRFQGWLIGAGVSIGHQWVLSNRWSVEASLGLGYAYLDYETYPCEKCGSKISDNKKHYFGPTKAAVSFIYILK